ncbi:MAG: serine hydroxymethyltransferase [Cohaesibacter sp.]|jgi:glycine hydroxymethyltransferase|nr:serine hydroxymethyltransferase [Cohaesibacter sp.]
MGDFFTGAIGKSDPLVADALHLEKQRQHSQIELIASENIVSRAVLDALGHEICNKTLEGYPGARFHGGGQYVDIVEQAAIDRAKQVFGADYANVQPHSGSQANLAVFFTLLRPGDAVLSLDLAAGGHLSHGLGANLSGRWFSAHHYGVERDSGLVDYDEVEMLAKEVRPKLLICGGSAYPREFDFGRMAAIARKVGAYFHVDMAHFAGLVAGGVHPSPLPHADIVTCTTTKTLRGPRGGMILYKENERNKDWGRRLQASVFPGVQGSLHTQVLAAKAVCLGEALQPSFADYAGRVKANAKALASTLLKSGIKLVSGGTDTHIVLLDLSDLGLKGAEAERVLDGAGITCNKNPIPFDHPRPQDWVGIRLGSSAATTRGLREEDFVELGLVIAELLKACADGSLEKNLPAARQRVTKFCDRYPIYP